MNDIEKMDAEFKIKLASEILEELRMIRKIMDKGGRFEVQPPLHKRASKEPDDTHELIAPTRSSVLPRDVPSGSETAKPRLTPKAGEVPDFDVTKIEWEEKKSKRGKSYEEALWNDGNPDQVKLRSFIRRVNSTGKIYARTGGYSYRVIDNGNIQRFVDERREQ